MEQVKEALTALYDVKGTTSVQRREANKWLEQFQKTPAAWGVADQLIRASHSSTEHKLFAAQTFRQKIEYDLKELDNASLIGLRDTILAMALEFKGLKPVCKQLVVALADLAIQMTAADSNGISSWPDPVGFMIDQFGNGPSEHIDMLLHFLSILPDELVSNPKLVMESSEYLIKDQSLIKLQSSKVLELLFSYLQQCNNNVAMQLAVLECLSSWIRSGSVPPEVIESGSIVKLSFEVLKQESSFDVGVDLICELLLVSAREPRHDALVQSILPLVAEINPFLKQNTEDTDIVKGMCRILCETIEGFADVIAMNFDSFSTILEAFLICFSNEDTDVSRITLNAWYHLSDQIVCIEDENQRASVKKQFFPVFRPLVDILVNHMKYPADTSAMSMQDKDEFREFRHDMGDILKECVRIIGEEAALECPFNLLRKYYGLDPTIPTNIQWQEIEAPLFSLRVMCREVSETEGKYIPEIMAMLPKLPVHPKIKYAAILVIGRYAQWSNQHPELLEYQLDFVSKGFQAERDTTIASAHAFRDLCKYCNKHLVNYLEQLQPFYTSTMTSLSREDRREMSEALSHLLVAVPIEKLPAALELFCMPVAQKIFEIISVPLTQEDAPAVLKLNESVDELGDLLAQIEIEVGPEQSHPTILFVQAIWVVLDQLITQHGMRPVTAEPIARCLRKIMEATQLSFGPVLASLLSRLVECFEKSKLSCYLWIAAKCVRVFGSDQRYQGDIRVLIEKLTEIVFQMVQMPEVATEEPQIVIEEYHYLLSQYMDSAPQLFISHKLAPVTLQCAIHCLSTTTQDDPSVGAILKYMIDLLDLTKADRIGLVGISVPELGPLMFQMGPQLVGSLFHGLIYTFSKDRELIDDVADILAPMSLLLGTETLFNMINGCVESFPLTEMSRELKTAFLVKTKSILEMQGSFQPRLAAHLRDFAAAYARRNLLNSRR